MSSSSTSTHHSALLQSADPYDLGLLRDEAARIKRQLYAEYGDQIEVMMRSNAASSSNPNNDNGGSSSSQVDQWQQQVDELIKYQVPLREQIHKCQQESIAKLIDAARDSQQRGVNVGDKLSVLLSLQQK